MDDTIESSIKEKEMDMAKDAGQEGSPAPLAESMPPAEEAPAESPAGGPAAGGGTGEAAAPADPADPADPDPEEAASEDEEAPLEQEARGGEPPAGTQAGTTGPAEAPAGPCAVLFNGLSYAGLPLLILLSAALTFWGVWHVRDLWFSDEVRIADVFMNLKSGGWLTLTLNGLPYADKPPLYFWMMEALTWIPGVTAVMAMFLASALSHALFIASVWLLARGTGHGRKVAFAAGLLTLGCLSISWLAGYVRMDLLFAALICLGMLCLYRGACKSSAPLWLLAGFLLMAAATLVKGPFGIALAVTVSIVFACWRGTPGRLGGRDGIPGFLLMLLIIAGWLGYIYMTGHQDYVRDMLGTQLAGRVLDGGDHSGPWWYYLPAAALAWLPWILVILFVNWLAAARGLRRAWQERREKGGGAWLWIWLLCGFAMLCAVRAKLAIYLLPMAPPLAVLTARSLLRLSPARSRGFFCLCSIILALAGLALVAVDAYPLAREFAPAGWLPALPPAVAAWFASVEGCIFIGSALIVLAVLLLLFVRTSRPDGALMAASLGLAAVMGPYCYFTAPSLGSVLSPRKQAAAMAEMSRSGYAAAAYRVHPGVYAWHLNVLLHDNAGPRATVQDLDTPEARSAWIAGHPKTIMAMSLAEWEGWKDRPASSSTIASSWMAGSQYVVAAINTEPEPPAAQPQDKEGPAPADQPASGPQESPEQAPQDSAGQALKELAAPGTQDAPSAGAADAAAPSPAPAADAPSMPEPEGSPQEAAGEQSAPQPSPLPENAPLQPAEAQ